MAAERVATLNVRPETIADLKSHPQNYRKHPPDQIEELRQSIREFGCWANASVSRDGYILRNHGIIEAARLEGYVEWPCEVRDFDHDDPRALKMLISDNKLSHMAEDDDRLLADLLKQVRDTHETGLQATGFDDMMLANLVMVSRPEGEIADFDAAAEWVGMPDMGEAERQVRYQLIVWCDNPEERQQAMDILGVDVVGGNRNTISAHWPVREREVREDSSLRYVGAPG